MPKPVQKNLTEILAAHRLFIESGRIKGAPADLREAQLSNADLRGAYLREVRLINANLIEADLMGADLLLANLVVADLIGANLIKANLMGANLSGANLSKADLSYAYLIEANLSKANLKAANLSEAKLSYADLSEADLNEADLSRADLSGANLTGANITNSDLRNANISGACLDDANTSRWNIEDIICTHLVTGPNKKRINYAPKEFEQKHAFLYKLADIVLDLPLSELTHYVGLLTESAINQHQPSIPIRFKGQEALSDKTTKLSFIVFAPDDDEVRKTQDQLDSIEQNIIALVGNTREIRQYVEDQREPKSANGPAKEIELIPGLSAPVMRPAEIERILTERYNQLPQIFKKVCECIQSSFPL